MVLERRIFETAVWNEDIDILTGCFLSRENER